MSKSETQSGDEEHRGGMRGRLLAYGSLLLSAVFVYASIAKAIDPGATARTVAFILEPVAEIPFRATFLLVGLLAATEFVLGAFLLLYYRNRAVQIAATTVMLLFAGVVLYGYSVELPGGCGCGLPFGSKDVVSGIDVTKTLGLFVIAVLGVVLA